MSALDDFLNTTNWYKEEWNGLEDFLPSLEAAQEELAELRARLAECEDNLKSMVEQYCRNGYCYSERGVPINKFSHDFMSAGECTFEYLVARGLAEYLENGVDIRLKPLEEK